MQLGAKPAGGASAGCLAGRRAPVPCVRGACAGAYHDHRRAACSRPERRRSLATSCLMRFRRLCPRAGKRPSRQLLSPAHPLLLLPSSPLSRSDCRVLQRRLRRSLHFPSFPRSVQRQRLAASAAAPLEEPPQARALRSRTTRPVRHQPLSTSRAARELMPPALQTMSRRGPPARRSFGVGTRTTRYRRCTKCGAKCFSTSTVPGPSVGWELCS